MLEEWRDIPLTNGRYQVSNYGNVKSCKYNHQNVEKVLKPRKDKGGYLRVSLFVDGKPKEFSVHRLVAEAFIPNPDNLPEVNHIDKNPNNNVVHNLEWCTRQYNVEYSRNKKVLCVETGVVYKSLKEAQDKTGVSRGNISSHIHGKLRHAGGLHWCLQK